MLWMSHTFEPKARKLNIVSRQRFVGHLDPNALEFAFQAVLKKHEILTYHILKLQPAQKTQKNRSFRLIPQNITALSPQQSELELQDSMTQLVNFHPWPKNSHLLIGRLFYLQNGESELQIGLPHLVSDDYCANILFSELSFFYQNFNQLTLDDIETDSHFKEYIFHERNTIKAHLERDISFWEDYLKDASLFSFPEKYVVNDMKAKNMSYSTYSAIPEGLLNHLKQFCELNHLSINNALCAIIALALRNCCGNYQSETPYLHMNVIQSTRDNPIYDNTIGCFLRVEPVKISLNETTNIADLSQQIRYSTIETSQHQYAPSLVKLCSISSLKPNKIEQFIIKLTTPLYTKLLKMPSLYRKILQRFGSKIISFKRNTKFVINLNIRNNFTTNPHHHAQPFGFNTKETQIINDDSLAIDYIFETGFVRDDTQKAHYLVISANLEPMFREQIAQEVLRILNTIELDRKHESSHHQEHVGLL